MHQQKLLALLHTCCCVYLVCTSSRYKINTPLVPPGLLLNMSMFILGLVCERSLGKSKEGNVLQLMTSTLNVTISKQTDPVRFADAVYSAGFISEETKMDSLSSMRNDYVKVSKVMSAVMTHITQQSSCDKVRRKFDQFILLLHGELKMKDLAKQLVDKLRELACP